MFLYFSKFLKSILYFQLTDGGAEPMSKSYDCIYTIVDVNDKDPVVTYPIGEVLVFEVSLMYLHLIRMTVNVAQVMYSILCIPWYNVSNLQKT